MTVTKGIRTQSLASRQDNCSALYFPELMMGSVEIRLHLKPHLCFVFSPALSCIPHPSVSFTWECSLMKLHAQEPLPQAPLLQNPMWDTCCIKEASRELVRSFVRGSVKYCPPFSLHSVLWVDSSLTVDTYRFFIEFGSLCCLSMMLLRENLKQKIFSASAFDLSWTF